MNGYNDRARPIKADDDEHSVAQARKSYDLLSFGKLYQQKDA